MYCRGEWGNSESGELEVEVVEIVYIKGQANECKVRAVPCSERCRGLRSSQAALQNMPTKK